MITGRLLQAIKDDVEDIFPAYSPIAKATVVAAILQHDALGEIGSAVKNFPEMVGHEAVLAFKHMHWDSAVRDVASAVVNLAEKDD